MNSQTTIEQLDEQITRLTPQEQLKLLARVSERLSKRLPPAYVRSDETTRAQRLQAADDLLAELDRVAELWGGEFDAVADIRRMREDRDAQQ